MSDATCIAPDCEKPWRYKKARLCNTHYERIRKNGTLELKPRRGNSRPKKYPDICTIEGCGRRSHLRSWCTTHYTRWRLLGDPGPADIESRTANKGHTCMVAGCDREAQAVGMCSVHRHRLRRNGDPGGEIRPQNELLEDISYSGMHERMRRRLGSARDRMCVDCGSPARHWSYSNNCSEERIDADLGLIYCLHLDCYSPRCVPCHWRYDLKGGQRVDDGSGHRH